MAKIGDITDWLIRVRGDEGQVRSLVKLLRADNLFSSSGRGRGSPDMTPSDFATAMACALSTSMTTHAPTHVREILRLKVFSVSVDPADGGDFRTFTLWEGADELPDSDDCGNPMLPPEIPNRPKTFGEALEMWAAHFMENPADGVMNFDALSLRTAASSRAEIELFNPAWESTGWNSDDGNYEAYAWKLRFESEGIFNDPMRRETVTTLDAPALKALAELAGEANS